MSFIEKITDAIHKKQDMTHPFTSAVIVAGGNGTRAGGNVAKQHRLIAGVPVIVRTLLTFEKSNVTDEIILVVRREDISQYIEYLKTYKIKKVKKITVGGDTRFDSVRRGFKLISDKARFVAIHDGARCLITDKNIRDVYSAAYRSNASCAVKKCSDTVKSIDQNGNITSTIDRTKCLMAQTPQVFKTELYRAALVSAKKDKTAFTDDCSIVEKLGFSIVPVECGEENIKITTSSDFYLAETILALRSRENGGKNI